MAAGPPAQDGPDDDELLRRFVAGDSQAFATLVDRHRERVYAICWRFFRDDADAEDATQEAFVALYRGASSFRGAARFSTWLYRVAMNTCHDMQRKRVRRPQSAGVDTDQVGAAADDPIAALELDIDLRRGLERLRPEHREVLVMHGLLGIHYAEIAERTGVALGTVKSRIHRASARLAELLAETSSSDVPADSSTPPSSRSEPQTPRVLPSREDPDAPDPAPRPHHDL